MPASDIAAVLNKVFSHADKTAASESEKFERGKQADIEVYKQAMKQPGLPPEKRLEYAQKLEKLYNLKGKEGPFSKIATGLNKAEEAHAARKAQQGQQAQGGQQPTPKQLPGGPSEATPAQDASPAMKSGRPVEQSGQPVAKAPVPLPSLDAPVTDPNVNPAQKKVSESKLHKVGKGLMTAGRVGATIAGTLLGPANPVPMKELQSLTPDPKDPNLFPSAEQEATNKGKVEAAEAAAKRVNPIKQYGDDLKEALPNKSDAERTRAVEAHFKALGTKLTKTRMQGPEGDGIYLTDENDPTAPPVKIGEPPPATATVSESSTKTDASGDTHTTRTTKKVPLPSKTGKLASEVGPPSPQKAVKTLPHPSGETKDSKGATGALAGVPEEVRGVVQEIGEYRADISKITSMRGAQRQKMMELVAKAYPGFDMKKYTARQEVLKSFTSGQDKKNILSLNTAIGHLQTLKESADALGNSSFPAANTARNAILRNTGDPRLVAFDNAANAVESEMANVFKGTGATDQEIHAWRKNLNPNMSPAQFQSSIDTLIELMGSRMNALSSTWENAFDRKPDFQLLNSQSKKILSSISGQAKNLPDVDAGETKSGGNPYRQ
jgi:hypothetical protein